MVSTVNLQYDDMQCVIAPAMGGSVLGWYKGGVPVLAPAPMSDLKSALDAASYPLVPYSNRIGYGQLAWEGQTYTLEKNFLPSPHSIHGTGWQSVWSVTNLAEASVQLQMHHQPNVHWPFEFTSHQHIELGPQGLTMTMSITNLDHCAVPAGLGWHPYFVKRADTTIAFAAAGRWALSPDKLPTECLPHTGLNCAVADLTVDHCFEACSGTVVLQDSVFKVQLSSDFDRLVVYTLPALDRIAVEPVSHVNNAFNRVSADSQGRPVIEQGVRRLLPGEQLAGRMHIQVEPATCTG